MGANHHYYTSHCYYIHRSLHVSHIHPPPLGDEGKANVSREYATGMSIRCVCVFYFIIYGVLDPEEMLRYSTFPHTIKSRNIYGIR